jgi:hypothetical protein
MHATGDACKAEQDQQTESTHRGNRIGETPILAEKSRRSKHRVPVLFTPLHCAPLALDAKACRQRRRVAHPCRRAGPRLPSTWARVDDGT